MPESLAIYAGREARRQLQRDGWTPDLFDTMIGASGGAKLLGIAGLDRFLFGDFLPRGSQPLHLVGSSIGSWRHAALTQDDPLLALQLLHHGYTHQNYEHAKPTPADVSEVSLAILDSFLGGEGLARICDHSRYRSHVVTARGKGPAGSRSGALQGLGLAGAAIGNTASRQLLQSAFQRVVFSSHGTDGLGFGFSGFGTKHAPLNVDNARCALHASGSIPFILTGERDIPDAPAGQYWDGGIVDYHFDLHDHHSDKLILYPHFGRAIVPGWFDKFLPWRKLDASAIERLVLICPSAPYLEALPFGKIPDRRDFPKMSQQERVSYWEECAARSNQLGEEMADLVAGSDPLAKVMAL